MRQAGRQAGLRAAGFYRGNPPPPPAYHHTLPALTGIIGYYAPYTAYFLLIDDINPHPLQSCRNILPEARMS